MKQADAVKLDQVFGDIVPAVEQVSNWRKHKTPSPETYDWDRSPIVKKVKGVDREFFGIGALAEALGRKTVTIRSWEDKGIFPRCRYRTKAPAPSNNGKLAAGRRLYTRQQIEAVVAIAKVTKVYDLSTDADWTEFSRLVRAAWAEL